jgi:hypothetical protein
VSWAKAQPARREIERSSLTVDFLSQTIDMARVSNIRQAVASPLSALKTLLAFITGIVMMEPAAAKLARCPEIGK